LVNKKFQLTSKSYANINAVNENKNTFFINFPIFFGEDALYSKIRRLKFYAKAPPIRWWGSAFKNILCKIRKRSV